MCFPMFSFSKVLVFGVVSSSRLGFTDFGHDKFFEPGVWGLVSSRSTKAGGVRIPGSNNVFLVRLCKVQQVQLLLQPCTVAQAALVPSHGQKLSKTNPPSSEDSGKPLRKSHPCPAHDNDVQVRDCSTDQNIHGQTMTMSIRRAEHLKHLSDNIHTQTMFMVNSKEFALSLRA